LKRRKCASILFDRRTGSGDVIAMTDDGTIFVQARGGGRAGILSAGAGWKPALLDRQDACPTFRFMEKANNLNLRLTKEPATIRRGSVLESPQY
jgi:hypothetical protein